MTITAVSIANRALQKVGAIRIAGDFTDNTKNAAELGSMYDFLRRAEMRRNVWKFCIRRAILRALDTTTLGIAITAYGSGTTYAQYDLVTYLGQVWRSLAGSNTGNTPSEDSAKWELYFGAQNAVLLLTPISSNTYFAGEIVYVPIANNTIWTPYFCISGTTSTTLLPNPPTWSGTPTYQIGDAVTGSDANVYTSKVASNHNNNPVGDLGVHWTAATNSLYDQAKTSWFPLSTVTLSAIVIDYPAGTGPISQSNTRNIFTLPYGFLREAPQDPKQGQYSNFGAPSTIGASDWLYEGKYIISNDTGPIAYRFAADLVDTSQFDPMFVELLACRIALEYCETATNSEAKMATIANEYTKFATEARMVSAIEEASIQSPTDDFLQVRV